VLDRVVIRAGGSSIVYSIGAPVVFKYRIERLGGVFCGERDFQGSGGGVVVGAELGSNEFSGIGPKLDECFDDFRAGAALVCHFDPYRAFHPEGSIENFFDAMAAARFGRLAIVLGSEVVG